jgi:hypothetical protein
MKRTTLYLFACLFCLSCKKEDVTVITGPSSTIVQISIGQVVNDSTIVLTWPRYTGAKFKKYRLTRTATYLKNGQFQEVTEEIDASTDLNHTSFTEKNMPYARDINYYIAVLNSDNQLFPPTTSVSYQRPNSLVYGEPTDVLFSKQQQSVYITERYRITKIDYHTGRQTVSKAFPTGIGFCSLGAYNGEEELYVPTSSGWLQIVDPGTLELKDKIYVAGFEVASVAVANDKLLVGSSDMAVGYNNCIKVYDRATKSLVSRAGFWDRTRVLLLNSSTMEFIDLSVNLMPIELSYYQFNANGSLLSQKRDNYHGDYPMDANIVRAFPDGSRFITSSSGTIFNKSLVFDRYIKQYGSYTDFAFNNNGSVIYAADRNGKKIQAISYPGLSITGSYTTVSFPYKIFRDENTLVCVGKSAAAQLNTYLVVEKINL